MGFLMKHGKYGILSQRRKLSEFFNVEVVVLSSFEEKEEQFKEQVDSLRQLFFNSIAPGGLVGNRRAAVPASGFLFSS
ncbi:hypothetical protein CQW23_29618 [Capsicum baccatum]|uniref:GB1/RHD3-type G domain-containing protein n=1 Tax=Capsicum baccatum TaxID=33114 RepID=A0A2G2VCR6_CAPBA|nr:hypothetical protein CQW23_29618 [Capsicum baccatum]